MGKMNMEFQPTFLRICIDHADPENDNISGRVCGVGLKDDYSFEGTPELLLLIDQCLDRIGKPQATRKSRSFHAAESENTVQEFCPNPPRYHTTDEIRMQKGKCRTVDVNIVTRYHSSWQGIMYDEDGKQMGMFSSDLQLLRLLVVSEPFFSEK